MFVDFTYVLGWAYFRVKGGLIFGRGILENTPIPLFEQPLSSSPMGVFYERLRCKHKSTTPRLTVEYLADENGIPSLASLLQEQALVTQSLGTRASQLVPRLDSNVSWNRNRQNSCRIHVAQGTFQAIHEMDGGSVCYRRFQVGCPKNLECKTAKVLRDLNPPIESKL